MRFKKWVMKDSLWVEYMACALCPIKKHRNVFHHKVFMESHLHNIVFFSTQLTNEWLIYNRYILPQFSSALLLVVKHFLKSSQFFVKFSQHREQCLKGKHMYKWREYKAEAGEKMKPCACEWKILNIFLLKFFFRCHHFFFFF